MSEQTEHDELNEIFSQALELDPAERENFLDEACQNKPKLREQVESLLKSFENIQDFIENPVVEISTISPPNENETFILENPIQLLNLNDLQSNSINPKLLRGDLDNIILMALRKEPERRYTSVQDFSDDISKYLTGLPISARPNTFKYRTGKFIQRNKLVFITTTFIIVAIILGMTISFIQYRQTKQEKAKAEEVKSLIQKILMTAKPSEISKEKGGYSDNSNEFLEQTAHQLDSEVFDNQPEVKAELEQLIGNIYLYQGQYNLSEKYLLKALAAQTQLYGNDKKRVLLTNLLLGDLYNFKANYEKAEKSYSENLPLLREELKHGNTELFINFFSSFNNYALLMRAKGDSQKSEMLYRENLLLASQYPEVSQYINFIQTMLNLTLLDQGKFDEAEAGIRKQVNEYRQTTNSPSLEIASNLTLFGSILMEKGNLTEAQETLEEAENIYRKLLSPNSIQIFDNLRLQAQVAYLGGNYSFADKLINQVLENYRQNTNPKYISFATALTIQGLVLNKSGKSVEAEKILREATQLRTENLPPNHFMTALTKGALGEVLMTNKKFDEAEQFLSESLESLKNSQAGENQRIILAKSRLEKLQKSR